MAGAFAPLINTIAFLLNAANKTVIHGCFYCSVK
jgi:hypothetical protein